MDSLGPFYISKDTKKVKFLLLRLRPDLTVGQSSSSNLLYREIQIKLIWIRLDTTGLTNWIDKLSGLAAAFGCPEVTPTPTIQIWQKVPFLQAGHLGWVLGCTSGQSVLLRGGRKRAFEAKNGTLCPHTVHIPVKLTQF